MPNCLQDVKFALNNQAMQRRFNDILGQKAPQFMGSIVNAVAGNEYLQECDPNSIISAALVAATFDLPIDNNLGFSAIVPYKGKAQFQMMYKGFVQLAIRSGYYEKMNYSEVYEDELHSFNPITGEVTFVEDFSECHQRENDEKDKIAGYYAWFKLKTGFSQELYMSKSMVENHARKYSQSYRYDIRERKQSSRWSLDFDAMAKKTVIKQLLSKWGILSIDMQRAIQDDQKVYEQDGVGDYADNPRTQHDKEVVIDAFAPVQQEQIPQQPQPQIAQQAPQMQYQQQVFVPQQPVQINQQGPAGNNGQFNEFEQFDQQFIQQSEGLPFR